MSCSVLQICLFVAIFVTHFMPTKYIDIVICANFNAGYILSE